MGRRARETVKAKRANPRKNEREMIFVGRKELQEGKKTEREKGGGNVRDKGQIMDDDGDGLFSYVCLGGEGRG